MAGAYDMRIKRKCVVYDEKNLFVTVVTVVNMCWNKP